MLCCNLYNAGRADKKGKRAIITANGGERFLTRISDGTVIGYKYFDFHAPKKVSVTVRGGAGVMRVCTREGGAEIACISVSASKEWAVFSATLPRVTGVYPLYFVWQGEKIDFLKFEFW